MKELTVAIPLLPFAVATGQGAPRRRQQGEEKKWREYIAAEWEAVGQPKFNRLQVTLIFSLSENVTGTLADYLAAGSKLVGEAIVGLLVPDAGPAHVAAWHFRGESGTETRTTILIEEDRKSCAAYRRPDCNLYETCNTPLCPLDQISLGGIWYPDEEICHSRTQVNLPWVKTQKKIVESGAPANHYFNLPMLERNCIIKKGIAGLDPDETNRTHIRRWFTEHPVKKEMSEEEKIARAAHLKKYRFQDADTRPRKRGFRSDFQTGFHGVGRQKKMAFMACEQDEKFYRVCFSILPDRQRGNKLNKYGKF